ncbi:DNA mismatch repair protein (Mlh3) [Aspergillus nomiae NRRL 13137]|uniref:DNA mismatch repair protein (Mlh3) n=1 Tax=Aspergillus nomiae NRRL (strain ATCC 15546 / NRRL 13137 / CBS 260.88 / M93) TaxID=1509407 RepID=A0A0L1IKN1_ASPN3|nr:DNA mismatch repair protein (Mlh3) [Aspergillus nomiae NRRL 13137]KNG80124.1 DNA mismatch repair protein (Mlh3) [Aspergillus nomiae NRRL 13137]
MSGNSRRIEPLPPEVVAKLKSSTSITHLNGVIVELVKNALDADARTVSVTVDFQRGGCKVDDDGDGILPTEFEPSGGLGKAHHTSKYHTVTDVYGQKGLFLASLSSLSLLTITSHHVRHPSTNTIMFHHSTPVARLIPAPVQQELRLSSHGTSVTVNDLFGNMPVRVKNRALALQRHDELDRQWDELRQQLVSLMLANGNLTKLVIIEASRDKRIIIRTQNHRTDGELDLQRIVSILAQAGLIERQNAHSWDTVSANVPGFSVHAAISVVPNPTKKIQFISLGMDPVFPKSSVNIFYAEVNRLFSLSDFGTTGTPSTSARGRSQNQHPDIYSGSSTKSTTKAINKWPMFYIRIDTNESYKINSEGHGLPESDKSVQRIMDVLAAMIQEFLKQHNLRPRGGRRKQKMAQKQMVGAPTSRSDRAPNHPGQAFNSEEALCGQLKFPNFQRLAPNVSQSFGEWSRIKSAHESFDARSTRPKAKSTSPEKSRSIERDSAQENLLARSERNKHRMFEGSDALATYTGFTTPETENGSGSDIVVHWTDPYTGRSHLVNSRTGQSVGTRSPMDAVPRSRSTGALQTMRECDRITKPRSAILSKTRNLWVEKMMDTWENPVFSRSDKSLDVIGTGYGTKARMAHARVNDVSADVCGFENLGLPNVRGKLRRQDLETAEIIAQVDRKFVLAKIKTTAASEYSNDPGSILVLIDQHAADERCRVERLFKEYFTPSLESSGKVQTVTLEPIIFDIPVTEADTFRRYKQFFEFWGVEYTVEQGPADKSACIYVHTLPVLIAERCRLEPELVTNLIRGHIWKREENGMGPEARVSVLGQDRWAEQLDVCPQGIVELLNSRACRTAIMFNDDLTTEECQSLVQNLARCVFPFQCAHGRPSMIPLLDMTDTLATVDPGAEYMSEEEEQAEFAEVFKAWRDKITLH